MTRHPRIHALLSTARVANVPSVASNVILGVVAAWISAGEAAPAGLPGVLGLLCLAGVSLYLAGNFFNDWMDVEWDARHRPERALPSGMFRRASYGLAAGVCGCAGLAAGGLAGAAASILTGMIAAGVVAYTVLHKRTAWAVVFMGGCRGLLVWLGAAAWAPDALRWSPTVALASAAVLAYVVALSLAARSEACRDRSCPAGFPASAAWFLVVPGVMLASPGIRGAGICALAGVLPYAIWMFVSFRARKHGVGALVSSLLAGIPLVDWILLLPVGMCYPADGSPGGAGAAWWVPPVAFMAALALQRVAPAT